ncbi:EamA-like transporter family [Desulfosporosinus orientis DSM 765]|uniref:EamA-like transporter family n=1 Tax=Desulfosporosinus orientis (strain ATCC 19365 / DSM 765 / NCIMB 8382 / VKM B-1628 / Singapore I) TaxID=768706 RepID=G7WCM3_DESOD|nr:EamA family transporter [Desulfosporosinus orientis]AET66561.1 EamA-like transporter family [Desulfosporosinus orientis DSM 765]
MITYFLPIVLVVTSNIVYHVCQKSTPQTANPFSALLITYLTAALLTLVAFPFYKTDKGFFQSFSELNWTSFALGVAIVGLEMGNLLAYRVGWNISVGSLVSNIILAVMLIPVGILFYKEGFALNQIFGVVFCLIGLILINK